MSSVVPAQSGSQSSSPLAISGDVLVSDHLIHAVIVGTQAFGLATPASDTDRRGVYVAPTASFWGFDKPPKHVEGPEPDWFSWEVERFCVLALAGNPQVLEALHSPLVITTTPLGDELVALRQAFLSQEVHETYSRYGPSQLRKLRGDGHRDGRPRWKQVMHVIRLLITGEELLRTGVLVLDVGANADLLLAVRRGEVPWPQVEDWVSRLRVALDDARAASPLPQHPDRDVVDAWLRSVRERSPQEALSRPVS